MGGGGGCPGTRVRVGVPPADGLGREDGVRRGRPHRVCEGWRGGGGLCPASRGGGTAGGWSSGVGGALRGRRSAGARRGTPCGHGPAAPRPACGRGPGGGTRRLGVDVGALARGACRAPRPPHPFQVPSASRRGGLKTPGGGCRPSALGFGAVGPAGSSRELPPVSPQTPPSPEGTGWRAAWRATVTAAAAVGRGLPDGRRVGRGRVRRRVRALPRVPGGGLGAPRAPVGLSEPALAAWRRTPRRVEPFPTPPFCCFLSDLAGQRQPPAPTPTSGEGGGGGWDVPRQGRVSRRNETLENLVRLLAVDHSARASMKNAASCEN